MWSVRVLSGPNAGQIFDLKLGKNVFGRGSNCDYKVQSVGISKEHCEIHVYKDKILVVDLKSSNGTFVNGVKIQNSILHVGDKISLFDIIMDLIPTPDIRPKNNAKKNLPATTEQAPRPPSSSSLMVPTAGAPSMPSYPQQPVGFPTQQSVGFPNQPAMSFPTQGGAAFQVQSEAIPHPENLSAPVLSLSQKFDAFMDNSVMPAIYRLAILFPFKHVLIGFILIFIFGVTLLSVFPLTTIIKESNYMESVKRAKSVARTVAKVNEQALLAGQLGNLTVQEALKEDGIKEAFIIQQSDGLIVAPSEKVGRDFSKPFILQALKESRSAFGRVDGQTIGASHPIGVYDPVTGEPAVKYHAIVFYDVSSLNMDEGRVISLFMQTLIIACVLGFMLYALFARLIEFPIKSLNKQIDQALRDKTDRTEVLFDDPSVQMLVTNVNTILTRALSAGSDEQASKPQQNRDLEYTHLTDMITQPAIVVAADHRIVALNHSFEQVSQMSREVLVNQTYQAITDTALVQNIDSLIVRSQQSPFEKHTDRIPFSQFECDIQCQAFLDTNGQPEYYLMTLTKAEAS